MTSNLDKIKAVTSELKQKWTPFNQDIVKLCDALDLAVESLKHLADKNYQTVDEGINYHSNFVCLELYTDKKLNEWASEQIKQIAEKVSRE